MGLRYWYLRSASALKWKMQRRWRKRRMDLFIHELGIVGGERIIDLGGYPVFWDSCTLPLRLTILNLPEGISPVTGKSIHEIEIVAGDACDVAFAADNSYDIAFSNSVIEHVGPIENQARMAKEVRRLAPRYWVQTPSIWFPIEPHNNMPFWWFYPVPLKRACMKRWKRILPEWSCMVGTTTVLLYRNLQAMLPEAQILTERVAGIPKSYIAIRR